MYGFLRTGDKTKEFTYLNRTAKKSEEAVSGEHFHTLPDYIWQHIDMFLMLGLIICVAIVFAAGWYFYKIGKAKEEAEKQSMMARRERKVLDSMSQIYLTVHVLELDNDRMYDFIVYEGVKRWMHRGDHAAGMMQDVMENAVIVDQAEAAMRFADLSDVAERLGDKNIISEEFVGVFVGWFRAQFIVVDRDQNGKPNVVIFTTQVIEQEKREKEALIRISKTDELTQLYNRRAYEEDIRQEAERKEKIKGKELIILSLDVNGLKGINDTCGHAAGDELIIAASKCMMAAFAHLGKIYRVGGDEFIVLLHTDKITLKNLLQYFDQLLAQWKGVLVERVSVSYGYAVQVDHPKMSLEQLAVEADRWMYAAKAAHYSETGYERRGMGGNRYFAVPEAQQENTSNEKRKQGAAGKV